MNRILIVLTILALSACEGRELVDTDTQADADQELQVEPRSASRQPLVFRCTADTEGVTLNLSNDVGSPTLVLLTQCHNSVWVQATL